MVSARTPVRLAIGLTFLVMILVSPGLAAWGVPGTPAAPEGPASAASASVALSHALPLAPLTIPRAALASAAAHPDSSYIDPFNLISSEPAPLGVADFGVTGTTGVVHAYSYASPVFQGNVQVNDLLTTGGGGYMCFQLNLMLVLTLGGTNYTYWVQEVASIDSNNGGIGWIDNIWNFSAGDTGAGGPITGVSGNGSAGSSGGYTLYADSIGSGYPGAGVNLAYPTNLSVRLVDTTINGYPQVGFEYNDGYGWVTWDNVTFHNMHDATNVGFLVDGFQYEPIGAFYDAEWVFCGSGYDQHDEHSNLDMSMVFWNGHNFQAPPNAYNFGSDTGESLNNVISSLGVAPANGSLYSTELNGSGTVGLLYNASGVSTLDVATPDNAAGQLSINGSAMAYRGGAATFTLAPGEYNIGLWVAGALIASANVTMAAGTTTHLVLPPPAFSVQFGETGLPLGTSWRVTVDGASVAGVGPLLNFSLSNGSYAWQLTPVPGFVPDAYAGTVPVNGVPAVINVVFHPYTLAVTFAAFDLPSGVSWSVELPGTTNSTTSTQLVVMEPNGTFQFNISTLWTFAPDPAIGNVTIQGGDAYEAIDFSVRPGTIAGTVFPINATVLVDGDAVPVSDGAFLIAAELPAFYTVEAQAAGYVTAWENVTVTAGNVSRADFTLAAVTPQGTGGSGNTGSSGPSNGFTTTDLALVIVAIVVVGGVGAFLLLRRPPRPRR
jgi:hypothetical protein